MAMMDQTVAARQVVEEWDMTPLLNLVDVLPTLLMDTSMMVIAVNRLPLSYRFFFEYKLLHALAYFLTQKNSMQTKRTRDWHGVIQMFELLLQDAEAHGEMHVFYVTQCMFLAAIRAGLPDEKLIPLYLRAEESLLANKHASELLIPLLK